jgi:hypothetical protein
MGLEGSNAGARLDSVEVGVVRVGEVDVGEEFVVGDDVVVVVRGERESFVVGVDIEVEGVALDLSDLRRCCCGCTSTIGVL